jgi:hypothetical protein
MPPIALTTVAVERKNRSWAAVTNDLVVHEEDVN